MSSLQRLIITYNGTSDDFKSQCRMAMGGLDAVNSVVDFLAGLSGGQRMGAKLDWEVGAVKASGTITISSTAPTNGETMTICGVTVTAVTSATNPNEFTVSTTPSVAAANLAACINASANLAGICSASAALGVVTLSAVVPGKIGNGLVMANVDLAHTVVVSFASGDDGTAYSQDLR